ncbi:toxin-antitoxin system YwqK family antitoxin [Seonamhaeicola sp. ML3]|uniref:toxin-antitoxin system YwqK family antitoxin n=1 Tax=Seonamhaeicola sp. ML3 TaxID=2937786 RepID=UPI00200D502D|nr:toxin-antitoxin system YwqK family antitoxin [Seonamhaeicola sp. ML3]
MKCIFFFLVIGVLIPFSAISQEPIENGAYSEFYSNGVLKISGFYRNNKKHGQWKSFYETGELERVYGYSQGELKDARMSFYKSGAVKSKRFKKNEILLYQEFYETGSLFFEKEVCDGYAREYYKSGVLKSEGNYIEQELNGIWRSYFDTGEIEWEIAYLNGYKHGVYRQFFRNGNLRLEGVNSEDKQNGIEKRFYETGYLHWEGHFLNDEFHGVWKEYDTSGKQINLLKYKKGRIRNTDLVTLEKVNQPNGAIETVPVYPGCEKNLGFKNRRACFSSKISKYILGQFNSKLLKNSSLTKGSEQRVIVFFEVSEVGNVTNVKVKSNSRLLVSET